MSNAEKCICLSKLDGMPPQVFFTVQIYNEFKVTCYNRSQLIPTREIVGKFSGRLETYDQLHDNFDVRYSST